MRPNGWPWVRLWTECGSAKETVIPAKGKAIVPTDISIALPDGCYGTSLGDPPVGWIAVPR